jgi:predicted O-methyltransferase YrrM
MTRQRSIAYSCRVPGWYTPQELTGLWEMCSLVVGRNGILEVGSFHGRSSSLFAHFALNLPYPVPITLIDPFLPWKGWDMERARRELRTRMERIAIPYVLIEQRVADIPRAQLPAAVDLVHIDGDHDGAAVELDCRGLLPLLRPGGIACFHDYRPDFAVPEVVERWCPGWPVAGTFGSMRGLRKPY